MKKIFFIIILMLLAVSVLYAIDAEIQNVEINGNRVSYTISLINNDKDSLYCSMLRKPYYYLVGKELHIQYYELKIPKGVLKDFPFVPYDKIITDSVIIEDDLTIEYVNSSTYVQKKKPISDLNVRKIIFEFGYMEDFDKNKIMVSLYDSPRQRDKFYYVTEHQQILNIVYTVGLPNEYNVSENVVLGLKGKNMSNISENISIPDKDSSGNIVTEIGRNAFENNTVLKYIDIADSVNYISYKAFSGCINLAYITFPKELKKTGYESFAQCVSLRKITIPEGTNLIDDASFIYCYSLTDVTLPDSLERIGEMAFCYCISLEEIVIPLSLLSLGDYAFSECCNMADISYKGTKEDWAKIDKGIGWHENVPVTVVHCIDGDAPIV